MEDLKERLLEDLRDLKCQVSKYESKTYSIKDSSTLLNDRMEYDRILGEIRYIKLMLVYVS